MNPIEKIILYFFQKNASPEELTALDEWSEKAVNRNLLKDYLKLWLWSGQLKDRSPQLEFNATWEEIMRRRKLAEPRVIWLRMVARYAAVALILLNLGWWGAFSYYDRFSAVAKQEFLIIADQTANSVVTLPDQTRVHLRKGSNIKYSSSFTAESREVFLDGEAYFDVTRDEDHPFVVNMEHAKVKVLGTRFNVSARSDSYQITLVDGSVIFKTNEGKEYHLLPDQMIEMNLKNRDVKIEKVNTELYTAWKDGKIIFRDETLGEITKKLELIYHVEFMYANPELAQRYRFSGTFHPETSIGEVITMLKLSIPMEVTRKEKFPDPDMIYLR